MVYHHFLFIEALPEWICGAEGHFDFGAPCRQRRELAGPLAGGNFLRELAVRQIEAGDLIVDFDPSASCAAGRIAAEQIRQRRRHVQPRFFQRAKLDDAPHFFRCGDVLLIPGQRQLLQIGPRFLMPAAFSC